MIFLALLAASFTSTGLLSSCAVQIKNERWYGFASPVAIPSPLPSGFPESVVYFDTLDDQTGTVDFGVWLANSPTGAWACTDTATLAEIKAEIEKLCSKEKICSYHSVANVLGKFMIKARGLEDREASK